MNGVNKDTSVIDNIYHPTNHHFINGPFVSHERNVNGLKEMLKSVLGTDERTLTNTALQHEEIFGELVVRLEALEQILTQVAGITLVKSEKNVSPTEDPESKDRLEVLSGLKESSSGAEASLASVGISHEQLIQKQREQINSLIQFCLNLSRKNVELTMRVLALETSTGGSKVQNTDESSEYRSNYDVQALPELNDRDDGTSLVEQNPVLGSFCDFPQ